jgi:hypothetical protein
MRAVPVRAVGAIDRTTFEQVEAIFAACFTLADLLAWCAAQSPRVQVTEIVTQDEYTHDIVLPFGPAFLSFDTT